MNTPHVTVDELIYDDRAPWAIAADGGGSSLNRTASNLVGTLATSWTGTAPNPGTVSLATIGPAVTATVRDNNFEVRPDLLDSFQFTFNSDVNVAVEHLTMVNDTLGGDSVSMAGVNFSYDAATFTATWDFEDMPDLDPGYYSFTLSDSVTAVQGNLPIDGDADGNAGGDYVEQIYVAIPGDANLDGVVTLSIPNVFTRINTGDVAIARANVNANFPTTWRDGDFNGDGNVTLSIPNVFTRINSGDVAIARANVGMDVRPPGAGFAASAAAELAAAQTTAVEFNDSDERTDEEERGNQRIVSDVLKPSGYDALDSVFSALQG